MLHVCGKTVPTHWPNTYIRVVTKGRTTKACVAIIIGCFLQFILARIIGCALQGKNLLCPAIGSTYFLVVSVSLLLISSASFTKIYKTVRNKMTLTARIKEYKSTVASFLYLINSAVTMAVYVGIAVYYTIQEQRMVETANLIMKTCPCNKYPLKPHFYIVKLGFSGVYLFFLFCSKT